MKKFVCSICGYVHEGDSAPEKCPQCGAPASKFSEQQKGLSWAAEHVVGVAKGVDEEILDGIDNDGDGLIDEDLRLVPLERAPDSTVSWIGIGRDSLDHDLNGVKEDSLELHLNEKNKLLFAVDFEPKKSNDSTYQANLRAIMEDTDSTKIKYPLKERQRLIGRCWNNYTEKEFKAWFRNR